MNMYDKALQSRQDGFWNDQKAPFIERFDLKPRVEQSRYADAITKENVNDADFGHETILNIRYAYKHRLRFMLHMNQTFIANMAYISINTTNKPLRDEAEGFIQRVIEFHDDEEQARRIVFVLIVFFAIVMCVYKLMTM